MGGRGKIRGVGVWSRRGPRLEVEEAALQLHARLQRGGGPAPGSPETSLLGTTAGGRGRKGGPASGSAKPYNSQVKARVRGQGCLRGEEGAGPWAQKFVYQKGPDKTFPTANFVFSLHFGLGGGVRGVRPNEKTDKCKPEAMHFTVRHECIFILYAKPG